MSFSLPDKSAAKFWVVFDQELLYFVQAVVNFGENDIGKGFHQLKIPNSLIYNVQQTLEMSGRE
jgi:hypothetical protein